MVKRKVPDEDTTAKAYVRHKEAQRQEKNKRRREAYARQKASIIKQQQGNLVPQLNAQDRICEAQPNVPGEKCAARNTAVETLSPTETKQEKRNRKRREVYTRKKQLSISDQGESAVISQCKRSTIRQKGQPPDRTDGSLTIEEEQKNKRSKRRRELYAQKKQISVCEGKAIVTHAAITLPTNISDKGKAQISWLSIYEIGSSSSRTLRQENRKRSNNKPAGKEPKCRKLVAPGEAMDLPPQPPCQRCHATRFYLEPEGFCCRKGQISLVPISTPPELWHLYTSDSIEADEFRSYIRTYNSSFAFTSFGVKKYDKKLCQRDKGIYTLRIQGQVYHYINELEPSTNNLDPSSNKLSHLQLYFYDTDHEVENRLRFSEKLRASIVKKLIRILEPNPYAIFFRSLSNINELDTH